MDPTLCLWSSHELLEIYISKALRNWMHGIGSDRRRSKSIEQFVFFVGVDNVKLSDRETSAFNQSIKVGRRSGAISASDIANGV